ncbi:RDD family protein [Cellulomonas sp. CW35]|uniref:RDD family protein n=1 Tax=Cellulomonas sp. CW35 TaxID=3458249 RepID=UPI0040337EB1
MIRHSTAAPAAGLGRRAAAVVVDASLTLLAGGWLWVVAGARSVAAAADGRTSALGDTGLPAWVTPACAAAVLVLTVAQWVLHGRFGWTVGRRLVGVRTVDERSRRPIGMWRVLLRGLVVAAGSLVVGVGQLVVLLSPLFDSSGRRQGWHDRAAHAMVLDVRGGLGTAAAPPPPPRPDLLRAGTTTSFRAPADEVGVVGPVPPVPAVPPVPPPPGPGVPHATGAVPRPLVLAPLAPHRAGPDLDTRALPLVPPPPAPTAAEAPAGESVPQPSDDDEDVESTRRRILPPPPPPAHERGTVTVAVVEISDGQRVEVRRTALVGRNPAAAADGVQLVRVVDPGRSVSKTHLQIAVEESGVWVADRGSTNGTVVTLPDGAQVICPVDQPVRLRLGSVVMFGDCAMRLVATS